MRKVSLVVGGQRMGDALTWAYPEGKDLGYFKTPVFRMTVSGVNGAGHAVSKEFNVLRFGVQSKDGKTARVVGLAQSQVHVIKAWLPRYKVHSAPSVEDGGWQVYGNFLIHDGPDHELEVYATIGCIEVIGPSAFVAFNDLLIELSGAPGTTRDEKLHALARAGKLWIRYEAASRPALTKAS